ncbi:glycosyltransferase family 4 protein [Candidatus Entotheonella palauensis]|uniref:glycosyltransferase family 4 protein n=1 Tax=Candidatus Entotheonella palauensis TaxID=93172 RepID=UPI000B7C950F|nr:glycosyltransferase [Candidatus Entotheonella palauensis]
MQKKILQISPFPPPRTGWSVRVAFLKSALLALGHQCQVLNIGNSRKVESPEYVCVYNAWDYLYKVVKFSAQGYTIHAHVNGETWKGLLLVFAAGMANRLFGKRYVLTFHGGVQQIYFTPETGGYFTPFFRLMFALSQRIICNNEAVKAKIAAYGVDPDKVVPIPAFTRQYLQHETVNFDPPLEHFLAQHTPVILSYIVFRDGFFIETLIEGFRRLRTDYPGVGLLLIGTESDESPLEAEIRGLIAAASLEPHVFDVPSMSHDEFRTAMKRCDLYIRTPITDGVCSSVLEALSYELPVVAAENGSRPPSVIPYIADDPQDLATQAANTLAHLDDVRQQIIKPVIRDTLSDEVNLLIQAAT